jgi:signal transduction histidine kinase/CheY-like chemotaxis protein
MLHDIGANMDALSAYQVLDTDPEEMFDDLVMLTAQMSNCSMSCISLNDSARKRLWFKSKVGFDLPEIGYPQKDNLFCIKCIESREEVYVIEDPQNHPIFKDNFLVEGGLKFYAAAPLVTPDGFRIGTLCVMENEERKFTDEQKINLIRLSKQAISLLELRLSTLRIEHLQEVNKELQRNIEEKTRVLGVVSHDIRQPLSSISASSELLLHDTNHPLTKRQEELVKTNVTSAKYITNLVGELLDIVRYDLGQNMANMLEMETVDLVSFVHTIIMQHVLPANRKNIRLKFGVRTNSTTTTYLEVDHFVYQGTPHTESDQAAFRLARRRSSTSLIWWNSSDSDDTHNSPSPVIASIDAVKMEQVVNNLLSNAIKFSSYDSTVEVLVGKSDAENQVFMSVKDTGQGIPDAEQHKLFRPFEKIAGVKPTGGESSTGLGLVIVKNIIEAHKGHLTVKSTVGEGSLFTVSLPQPVQTPQRRAYSGMLPTRSSIGMLVTDTLKSPAVAKPSEDLFQQKLNVLIADDNAVNSNLLTRVLEKYGHSVRCASDGQEALQIFELEGGHEFFHVVLLDEEMPIKKGSECIAQIRSQERRIGKHIPIISVSGNDSREFRDYARRMGADAVCEKPFKIQELVKLVESQGYAYIAEATPH